MKATSSTIVPVPSFSQPFIRNTSPNLSSLSLITVQPFSFLKMFFSKAVVSLACIVPVIRSSAPDVSAPLQNFLNQAHKGPLYTYPTSLTQGIVPVGRDPSQESRPIADILSQKGVHSHNDYWRDVPFYSALSVGAVSIEADVWLYNETLYVGHEQGALTTSRTFQSLYLDPILDTLHRQNPTKSPFITSPTHNGVFDTASTQTLYLFVDVKTDGPKTWPYVVRALEPL